MTGTAHTDSNQRPRIIDWGLLSYGDALARQHEIVNSRLEGLGEDTIARVEHTPTITLGRNAPADDLLLDAPTLAARGISVVRSDRGGRATYHGPGQAVVYPIVSIAALGLGVRRWVELLEAALLDTLSAYGIEGRLVPGQPGIWTEEAKIASIGLRIREGVSYHGVALNVGLDVSGFDCIVACGVPGQTVTSIAAASAAMRASTPGVHEAGRRLAGAIADRIERTALARATR